MEELSRKAEQVAALALARKRRELFGLLLLDVEPNVRPCKFCGLGINKHAGQKHVYCPARDK